MKLPIVIIESFDISVHPTVRHAETSLEPVDVKDAIYTAYDCEGYLLDLMVILDHKEKRFLCFKWLTNYNRVKMREHIPRTNHSEELKLKLIHYLVDDKTSEEALWTIPLAGLIDKVAEHMPWKMK